jgi:hypothetical protein
MFPCCWQVFEGIFTHRHWISWWWNCNRKFPILSDCICLWWQQYILYSRLCKHHLTRLFFNIEFHTFSKFHGYVDNEESMLKTFYDCKNRLRCLSHVCFRAIGRLLKAHLHTDVELLADAITIENFLSCLIASASDGNNIYWILTCEKTS